jgi:hypothetical protein
MIESPSLFSESMACARQRVSGMGLPELIMRRIAILPLIVLMFAAVARADIMYDVTITNATFSATCVGSTSATCSEVVNGSFLYDPAAETTSSASLLLTGSFATSLVSFEPADNFVNGVAILGFTTTAPTPPLEEPLLVSLEIPNPLSPLSGNLGSESQIVIPGGGCGGLPNCGAPGTFPTGTLQISSGTFTATIVQPAPEPSALILSLTVLGMVGFLIRRKLLGESTLAKTGRRLCGLNFSGAPADCFFVIRLFAVVLLLVLSGSAERRSTGPD